MALMCRLRSLKSLVLCSVVQPQESAFELADRMKQQEEAVLVRSRSLGTTQAF